MARSLREGIPRGFGAAATPMVHFLDRGTVFEMGDDQPLREVARFGVFELDLQAGELRKQGMRVRLQEQPFLVLAQLVKRPGELLTREELQKKLWPGESFGDFEHGLNKAISKIREALGDSAENPRFVETIARRGYRFLPEVQITAAPGRGQSEVVTQLEAGAGFDDQRPPASATAPPAKSSGALGWKLLAAALLLVIAALAGWKLNSGTLAPSAIRSLAVLPLESLSNDTSQDYFADGMTDELISDLGQIKALRVISRTSVMTYKHARKPLPEIARELHVDAVVEGTVLRSGDRVRITAQLIDAASDKHLWSQSYEGELKDILALQNRVASAIASEIRIQVNPAESAALKTSKVVNPAAYESYLKGRYFWNKRTTDGLRAALAYFNQAIEDDPTYAQAYSGLADTYALLGDWQYAAMTTKEALPKAKAAALKALQLNDTLAETHNSLAFVLDGFDWDFAAADKEFRRAIALNPGYATAHHWYAWHLALLGHFDEAIAEMRKAENQDPLSLIIHADLAELLVLAHAYDEAIEESRKTIEMDVNFALAHLQLGQAYLQKKDFAAAIPELQKAVELSGRSPVSVANLARAYAASSKKSETTKLLNELQKKSSPGFSHASEISVVYASLGDIDQAIRWLEKGYEERFNPGVLLRPGLDPLRNDPRFQDMLRRVGLPH